MHHQGSYINDRTIVFRCIRRAKVSNFSFIPSINPKRFMTSTIRSSFPFCIFVPRGIALLLIAGEPSADTTEGPRSSTFSSTFSGHEHFSHLLSIVAKEPFPLSLALVQRSQTI
ncbi:hypothetical protein OCU04_006105 [Sclerotinia nivalis]|uniref:Uncharacterized protein n=1 Tax=Sclerotinia nivalis TaxID=352851 RepID=A0A9X0DLU4_9HELO|nr:hypothetical protein OCU04_006105 [Sclerotinia nivalis]